MSEAERKPEEPEIEQEPEKPAEKPLSYAERQEAKAIQSGWMPEEDWIAKGNDPEKWVPADIFNVRGDFIGKLKAKEAEIEGLSSQMQNLAAIKKAENEYLRSELEKTRTEAIKDGNVAQVNDIDKQLANLRQPVTTTDPVLDRWNADNPWINEDSPKSAYAKEIYRKGVASGKTSKQIIDEVDAQLAIHYPKPTTKPPVSEGGSGAPKKAPKTLTMDDLTPEELKFRSFNPEWKDEKTFLKAVKDARDAENG